MKAYGYKGFGGDTVGHKKTCGGCNRYSTNRARARRANRRAINDSRAA